eukprot:Nitzschia sp. Nitz4//scaffold119_size111653//54570//56593//NITZ4_004192-RA/size111653-processed-gene-0.188-mRNA-1//-1//CDS//3329533842//5727//frame0
MRSQIRYFANSHFLQSRKTRALPSLWLTGNRSNLPGCQAHRLVHAVAKASPRDMADLEDRVFKTVGSSVKDPILEKSLSDLGWMTRKLAVSQDGTVQVLLKVATRLHPMLDELKQQTQEAVREEIKTWASEKGLDGDEEPLVNVEALPAAPVPFMAKTPEEHADIESKLGPGLTHVAHFLAVYSCKGGVGKSTVAVNLAYELARLGGRVGLLDLDVYGPSLPVLVQPEDVTVRRSPLGNGMVYPIEHKGVKMLSLGFVSSNSGVPGSGQGGGASVLRGPLAGKVVNQLVKGTDWGDLDVLVLDMPPGTGDVQLTLCQDIDLSGAVGVTTPSKLAIADARKGIEMFSELGVPTLAMVENMSYFVCEGGTTHYPFGKGFKEFVENDACMTSMKKENVCQFPISSHANDATETGVPLSLARPQGAEEELESFSQLAKIVSLELLKLPHQGDHDGIQVLFDDCEEPFGLSSLSLVLDGKELVLRAFSESGGLQKRFNPMELRKRDPKSGIVLEGYIDEEASTGPKSTMVETHKAGSAGAASESVVRQVGKKSRIGFEVIWGDGAKFIYSKRSIALAAGGKIMS